MKYFVTSVCLFVCAACRLVAQPVPSLYVPLAPCRILDTRFDPATADPLSPLAAGTTTSIDVRGRCNVPAEANAVAAQVHAFAPGPNGALLLWESCTTRPGAATIAGNVGEIGESGFTIARLAFPEIECGTDVDLYNSGVSHAAVDVVGYYLPVDACLQTQPTAFKLPKLESDGPVFPPCSLSVPVCGSGCFVPDDPQEMYCMEIEIEMGNVAQCSAGICQTGYCIPQ